MSESLSSVCGHSVHFEKFPMLRFSKGYSQFPQFSSNINQTLPKVNRGKYRLLLFLVICQILKIYRTWTISHLSYTAIIHKAMLVHLAQDESDRQGPLDLVTTIGLCRDNSPGCVACVITCRILWSKPKEISQKHEEPRTGRLGTTREICLFPI